MVVVANGCLGVGQMLGDNVYASEARAGVSNCWIE
jgi:hypothetical protein